MRRMNAGCEHLTGAKRAAVVAEELAGLLSRGSHNNCRGHD